MYILGITHKFAFNSAACLIRDGELLAFAEEERFNRIKQAPQTFPFESIKYCLNKEEIQPHEVDEIAIGFEKIETIWKTVSSFSFADYCNKNYKTIEFCRGPDVEIYFEADTIRDIHTAGLKVGNITWHDHHECHAASSIAASKFSECNYITIDGDGGRTAGRTGFFKDGQMKNDEYFHCIGSIGTFYEEVTKFLGFQSHQGEGKTMGLASYGKYDEHLLPRHIFFRNKGGVLQIDRNEVIDHFNELENSGLKEEIAKDILCADSVNLAHTAQKYFEEILIDAAKNMYKKTGCKNFALSGGSLLNCSANGQLLKQDFVEEIFVQPASHDAGTALGAAILGEAKQKNKILPLDFNTAYWGSSYVRSDIEPILQNEPNIKYEKIDVINTLPRLIHEDFVVGYFSGRSEVGPRALCNRSILANPTKKENLDRVNKIKDREFWRPLAPVIAEDNLHDIVDIKHASPFMLIASTVKEGWRKKIPAVTHVDNTCRPQSLNKTQNFTIYNCLKGFEKMSGCPVFMNTSFNLRGEPIVDSPQDALKTFLKCDLDYLIIENFLITK